MVASKGKNGKTSAEATTETTEDVLVEDAVLKEDDTVLETSVASKGKNG